MTVKTTRLLGRLMSIALLWIGFVSATNGIEDFFFNATTGSDVFEPTKIQSLRNGGQTRGLLVSPQITILQGQYNKEVLNINSLRIAFVGSNIAWRSVRCYLWGSANSKAPLSEMRLVRSWSYCQSPVTIPRFPYDGSYYFRIVGHPLYSSLNAMASSQWIIEREAPRMILTSRRYPCGINSCRRFSFIVIYGIGVSRYECRVNYGHWFRCTSPYILTVPGKSKSKHTFQVRSIDGYGNVNPIPATYSGTLSAGVSASRSQSSNVASSNYPADSPDEDGGSSSGSSAMLVVYIVVPIVGVIILAGLIFLGRRALLKHRLNNIQPYG